MLQSVVRMRGDVASRGVALGPVFYLPSSTTASHNVDPIEGGKPELVDALETAVEELTNLLGTLTEDEEASGMIEFQLAMIEDETLRESAFDRIEQGDTILDAWGAVMNAEVSDYETAEDDYFRARASDMRDIRDRVTRLLTGVSVEVLPENTIVVADEMTPTRFLSTSWGSGGIALTGGSVNSHVAMLARSRHIPMIVGIDEHAAAPGRTAVLDAEAGELIIGAGDTELAHAESRIKAIADRHRHESQFLSQVTHLGDGTRVNVLVNIAEPGELASVDPDHCDGIGLVRTEFLFHGKDRLPSEEAQYAVYRNMVKWAQGKPVTIRTLDAGGDKPVAGLTRDDETNPFLGVRGIRLSLLHEKVFRTQLRALLRAAADGPLKIMLPMVTVPDEITQVRDFIAEEVSALKSEGENYAEPPLGIMVEVPAVAICIDRYPVDFFSIGSNDLLQYVTACSRDAKGLSNIARPDNPALIALIEQVVQHANKNQIDVSLCGEMAGDTRFTDVLLSCGLRNFSVSPGALGATKTAIIEQAS